MTTMNMKLVLVIVTSAACGGSHGNAQTEADSSFSCRDRIVSYMASGAIAASETGVQMDCKEAGPRIKRWTTDKQGNRKEDQHAISPGAFDKVWAEIDGTGWPNLHDCVNGSLGKHDPVYVFDIKDDQNTASFQCQTVEMPYPYNDITDPLDLEANQGQHQLDTSEPAEVKARPK